MLSKNVRGGIVVAVFIAYLLRNKFSSVAPKQPGQVVETQWGSVRGIISVSRDGRKFHEWLGIPYAKPPVGPLRFATTQPLDEKWDGARDAKAYGSACAQMDLGTGTILGHEDCLFLNIHVPQIHVEDTTKRSELLSVLFFIHGGSFMSGSSDQFKPNYFMDEDVVLVTINYRLGALGFLSTGDAVVRGNMGLKDQSMALKWVHKNIASFGGDPKKITIFGQSAGSSAVHLQMLSPMSRGLIHRAISQSGSALNIWAINEDPFGQAKSYARKLNCPVEYSTEILDCLRNTNVNALLEVHREAAEPLKTIETLFTPVVEAFLDEETFLGHRPLNILKSRQFDKIPWLAGFNKDEGLQLTLNIIKNEDFRTKLENDWSLLDNTNLFLSRSEKQYSAKIREFYFGAESGENKLNLLQNLNAVTNLCTDRWLSYGIQKAGILHSGHAPAQLYFYNKTGPSMVEIAMMINGRLPVLVDLFLGLSKSWFNTFVLRQEPTSYGVAHGDENIMLFEASGLLNIPQGDSNYEFSKDLVKAWVSFASESNVKNANFRGVKFPILNPNGGDVQVLQIDDVPKATEFPIQLQQRIRFWQSIDVSVI